MEEKWQLEDQIRDLAKQCKCYSYNGPCRFCLHVEKLQRKVDRIDAEDEVLKQITEWLNSAKLLVLSNRELIDAISFGIATKEWKKPAV